MFPLLKDLTSYEIGDARYELVIVPSGSFGHPAPRVITPAAQELHTYGVSFLGINSTIFNPFKIPEVTIPSEILDASPIKSVDAFLRQYRKADVRTINEEDSQKYSQSLVEMAFAMKSYPAACNICPLRGGLKPTLQLQKMNVIGQPEFLPFTRGSSGEFDEQLKHSLRSIVDRYLTDDPFFHVNVIDTADGGNGSNKLAELLRAVRSERKSCSVWLVNMFLLHPLTANVSRIEHVASYSNEQIVFNVHRYVVDDLLVEDWDSAIGVKVEHNGGCLTIKNSIRSGRLILIEKDSVSLVQSDEMCQYVDVLYANAISDEIRTRPDLQFYRNVYTDYLHNR